MLKAREVIYLAIYLALALMGMTLIKMGANDEENRLFQIAGITITQKLILGELCYGLSFLMYTVVISKMQISLALPIVAAVNSVAIVIIGLTIFHEQLRVGQLVGIGIVLIGVLVIGLFGR